MIDFNQKDVTIDRQRKLALPMSVDRVRGDRMARTIGATRFEQAHLKLQIGQ